MFSNRWARIRPRTPLRRALLYTGVGTGVLVTTPFALDALKPKPVKDALTAANDALDDQNSSWVYFMLTRIPMRTMSRAWGYAAHMDLPVPMRAPLYKLWGFVFGSNMDEIMDPLDSFTCLAQFFSRRIWVGAERPIARNVDMTSPVDGRVVSYGRVENNLVGHIKGVTFPLDQLLGGKPPTSGPNSNLHYVVLYLAPGDYHRIHSPTNWKIEWRNHIAGDVFPVLPRVAKYVPNLFTLNERIVLAGRWQHGFFSVTPVGAYNVGSIKLSTLIDPHIETNRRDQDSKIRSRRPTFFEMLGFRARSHRVNKESSPKPAPLPVPDSSPSASHNASPAPSPVEVAPPASSTSPTGALPMEGFEDGFQQYADATRRYQGVHQLPGDEIGCFHLGSSVVIVFETPKDTSFFFQVKKGDRVRVGEAIGLTIDS